MENTMRAILTFSTDPEEILEDTALILNKRVEVYNQQISRQLLEKIPDRLAVANLEQLQQIVLDMAAVRTQLAKLDFALEDSIKIVAGYYKEMTTPAEEPTTNDEV
tara:strand:+ start:230 stop:547 length:318 start_codon:yes stop_codon:yes gene_type:complete